MTFRRLKLEHRVRLDAGAGRLGATARIKELGHLDGIDDSGPGDTGRDRPETPQLEERA